MPVPKNGRKPVSESAPPLPEQQEIDFNSNTLVPEEFIAQGRLQAQLAQKDAQIAALQVQLLETRNELIKAREVIASFTKDKEDGDEEGSTDKNQARPPAQAGRRGNGKQPKANRARS